MNSNYEQMLEHVLLVNRLKTLASSDKVAFRLAVCASDSQEARDLVRSLLTSDSPVIRFLAWRLLVRLGEHRGAGWGDSDWKKDGQIVQDAIMADDEEVAQLAAETLWSQGVEWVHSQENEEKESNDVCKLAAQPPHDFVQVFRDIYNLRESARARARRREA